VFASPREFLHSERPDVPICLVLDVRLPGLSGLDFQAELMKADVRIPIVFISGHGDIPMTVRAMKAGAVDFLAKPFRDQDLLDAVTAAIQRDEKRREQENRLADLKAHFSSLTAREREIMALVASGLMSKQIAAKSG
jgi:FixJ family two-component response regulator